MTIEEECIEADAAMAEAYRRQCRECLAAMRGACAGGRSQAAVLLAVQAVRTAANALLVTQTGVATTGHGADPVSLLYEHLPRYRRDEHLSVGAEVLAYDEDLRYYGYEAREEEACALLDLAERFCNWATAR
jgi:hypothetical protein